MRLPEIGQILCWLLLDLIFAPKNLQTGEVTFC